MTASRRASRWAALALLAAAACGAIAAALIAATTPSQTSAVRLLPLIGMPIGVIISGHLIRRGAVAWGFLLPVMAFGWYFLFLLTWGTLPLGLYIALIMGLAIAVYPFDASSTRLLGASAVAVGILSITAAGYWFTDTDAGRIVATIIASLAVIALGVAGVRGASPRRER